MAGDLGHAAGGEADKIAAVAGGDDGAKVGARAAEHLQQAVEQVVRKPLLLDPLVDAAVRERLARRGVAQHDLDCP